MYDTSSDFDFGSDVDDRDADSDGIVTADQCSMCGKTRLGVRVVRIDGHEAKLCPMQCFQKPGWRAAMPVPDRGSWKVLRYRTGVTLPEVRTYTTEEIARLGLYLYSGFHLKDEEPFEKDSLLAVFDPADGSLSPLNLAVGTREFAKLRATDRVLRRLSFQSPCRTADLWQRCCELLRANDHFHTATTFVHSPGAKERDGQVAMAQNPPVSSAASVGGLLPDLVERIVMPYFTPTLELLHEERSAILARIKEQQSQLKKVDRAIGARTAKLLSPVMNAGKMLWDSHTTPLRKAVLRKRKPVSVGLMGKHNEEEEEEDVPASASASASGSDSLGGSLDPGVALERPTKKTKTTKSKRQHASSKQTL